MYRKILIPTDGSECSEAAIRHGVELASSIDAEVTFMYALEPLPSAVSAYGYAPYDEDIVNNLTQAADAVLEEACKLAKQAGVSFEKRLEHWVRPSDGITTTMSEYDLVVMGSHGRSGVSRMLLGSVTERVVRQSTRPVLVVRCTPEEPKE